MPRGCRPPGPLYIWQPDGREDEKPHQSIQDHLQDVPGSTSQRLSRGQCRGENVTFDSWRSRRCSLLNILSYFCICAGNGGYQTFHREAASPHQWRVNSGVATKPTQHHQSLFGLDSSETPLTPGATDLLDNKTAATHRARQDWGYNVLARERHDCNDAASWPGVTHSLQCYSRVTLVAFVKLFAIETSIGITRATLYGLIPYLTINGLLLNVLFYQCSLFVVVMEQVYQSIRRFLLTFIASSF